MEGTMMTAEAGLTEARAVRYFDAARVLNQQTREPDQSYWEPINHLLAMAAELTLKAFLLRAGEKKKKLTEIPTRHDLRQLLRLAVGRGLKASKSAVEPLLHIAKAHKGHSFRYCDNLSGNAPALIFSVHTDAAIAGIGQLLDQSSPDPTRLRNFAASSIAWPYNPFAHLPVTADQLERLIEQVEAYQKSIANRVVPIRP
jgi:hypothetical protein